MKLFLALIMFSNLAFAFDFKGIEVGESSLVESVEKSLFIECRDGSTGWDVLCSGKTTIVGTEADVFVTMDKNHIVQSISVSFNPNSFDEIALALVKKYGKTKIKKSTLTNAMGASFKQTEMLWKANNSVMFLKKYSDSITQGVLQIYSATALDAIGEKIEKHKSDI